MVLFYLVSGDGPPFGLQTVAFSCDFTRYRKREGGKKSGRVRRGEKGEAVAKRKG